MNVRTALISSALLLAVLGWACEQQGPTGPSALATPGGGSLGAAGGVSLGAASGAILGVKKDCVNNPNDRRCKPTEEDPEFEVTVTGDISGGPQLSTRSVPKGLLLEGFELDLTFFQGKLTCPIPGKQTGNLTLGSCLAERVLT